MTDYTSKQLQMADARIERALLNLPRLLDLEMRAASAGLNDPTASSHFLSRLIIALNTIATALDAHEGGDQLVKDSADLLWRFGEKCGTMSMNLKMDDAARSSIADD